LQLPNDASFHVPSFHDPSFHDPPAEWRVAAPLPDSGNDRVIRSKLRAQAGRDHRHRPTVLIVGGIGDKLVVHRRPP
jgi:hypothetical protein